jgi:hypothetical protein
MSSNPGVAGMSSIMSGSLRAVIHVINGAAARHRRLEGGDVAARLVGGALSRGILDGNAKVMKAVAATVDQLLVDRRMLILRLNQLDAHVAGERHRNADAGTTYAICTMPVGCPKPKVFI